MQCKLNRLSPEEMTDMVVNIRETFISNIKGLSVGEVVEMLGLFLADACHDVSQASNGTATQEAVLGGIHQLASKALCQNV